MRVGVWLDNCLWLSTSSEVSVYLIHDQQMALNCPQSEGNSQGLEMFDLNVVNLKLNLDLPQNGLNNMFYCFSNPVANINKRQF